MEKCRMVRNEGKTKEKYGQPVKNDVNNRNLVGRR